MKKTILVTGGAGFIGSNFVDFLFSMEASAANAVLANMSRQVKIPRILFTNNPS